MTRQDKTGQDKTGQAKRSAKTRQDKTRQDKTRQDKSDLPLDKSSKKIPEKSEDKSRTKARPTPISKAQADPALPTCGPQMIFVRPFNLHDPRQVQARASLALSKTQEQAILLPITLDMPAPPMLDTPAFLTAETQASPVIQICSNTWTLPLRWTCRSSCRSPYSSPLDPQTLTTPDPQPLWLTTLLPHPLIVYFPQSQFTS